MNNIDRLIDILKTNNELDEMYLEAINSQAETLDFIGFLVSLLLASQLIAHIRLRRLEKQIEGDQE
jgi:hypothetical protein